MRLRQRPGTAPALALLLALSLGSTLGVEVDRPGPPVAVVKNHLAHHHRKLLGHDGDPVTPYFSNSTQGRVGICTTLPDTLYAAASDLNPALGAYPSIQDPTTGEYIGDLVVDNHVCVESLSAQANIYGGSAQGYGAARPLWETYGWQGFKTGKVTQNLPGTFTTIPVQTLQLWLVGTRGLGFTAGTTCTATSVSVAIFESNADGSAIGALKHAATVALGAGATAGKTTFTWTGNQSSVVTIDVTTAMNPVQLDPETWYWLRVKVAADYTTTNRCFVYWATSSSTSNGWPDGRWQETVGGAAGYSTNCVGAADDVLTDASKAPAAAQSLFTCFNTGVKGGSGSRRCLSYKNQLSTPLSSCPAGFRQYAFSLLGFQGQALGAPDGGTTGGASTHSDPILFATDAFCDVDQYVGSTTAAGSDLANANACYDLCTANGYATPFFVDSYPFGSDIQCFCTPGTTCNLWPNTGSLTYAFP